MEFGRLERSGVLTFQQVLMAFHFCRERTREVKKESEAPLIKGRGK